MKDQTKPETKPQTKAERKSEREFVVTRVINGPQRLVFDAWAKAEIFKTWWIPKSAPMKLESCEMDVRTGGKYRLKISMDSQAFEFFGRYLDVIPSSRLVWTNDEGGEEAAAVTTVTLEAIGDTTSLTVHDLYPSKEALDEAIASGATGGMPEQLAQLDELIALQRRA